MKWKDKTHGGFPVRLYCEDAGGVFPIHGAYLWRGSWYIKAWGSDGKSCWDSTRSMDLVRENPEDKDNWMDK